MHALCLIAPYYVLYIDVNIYMCMCAQEKCLTLRKCVVYHLSLSLSPYTPLESFCLNKLFISVYLCPQLYSLSVCLSVFLLVCVTVALSVCISSYVFCVAACQCHMLLVYLQYSRAWVCSVYQNLYFSP